jgi:hypothetical protein
MSIHEEAGLILKLYELRRDETMRAARHWYVAEFFPDSMADFNAALFGAHSGHLRMMVTYWDMAAVLVNRGAIGMEMFNEANQEHLVTFMKIEPLLPEIRATAPQFAANLEKLIDATPGGREKIAAIRERFKGIRAHLAQQARG